MTSILHKSMASSTAVATLLCPMPARNIGWALSSGDAFSMCLDGLEGLLQKQIWEKTGRMETIAVSNVRPTSFYAESKSFVPIQSMTGSSFLPSRFHLTFGAMTSTWLLLLGTISKQPPVWCSSKTAKGKRFNLYSGLFVGYVLNFNLRMKRILGSRVPQPRIKFKRNEDRTWQWESREASIQI